MLPKLPKPSLPKKVQLKWRSQVQRGPTLSIKALKLIKNTPQRRRNNIRFRCINLQCAKVLLYTKMIDSVLSYLSLRHVMTRKPRAQNRISLTISHLSRRARAWKAQRVKAASHKKRWVSYWSSKVQITRLSRYPSLSTLKEKSNSNGFQNFKFRNTQESVRPARQSWWAAFRNFWIQKWRSSRLILGFSNLT